MPPVSNTIPTEEAANGIARLRRHALAAWHTAFSDSLRNQSTGNSCSYPPRSVLGGTQGNGYDREAVRLPCRTYERGWKSSCLYCVSPL